MNEKTTKVELPEIPGFEPYKAGDVLHDNDEVYRLSINGDLVKSAISVARFTPAYPLGIYYRRIEPENPPLPTKEWCEEHGYEFPTVCGVPTKDNCDAWCDPRNPCLIVRTKNITVCPSIFGGRRWLLRKKQPKWNEDNVPVVPFIKSRDLPDDVIAKAVERAVYYWNHPEHECWNTNDGTRYEYWSKSNDLDGAFSWKYTEEGYDFWYDINYATQKKQPPLSFETWQGALSIKARRKSDNNIVCLTAVPKGLVKEHKTEAIDRITYSEAERDYETLDGGKIGRCDA